ncbi:stage 0 sporulation protein [Clostridiales bacterium F-3ap]|uniref:Stage 0 sporulation protein n=1 Tax=Anaerotalea alkaliphila TaxID=2662126 RepID=A0A7X5HW38_9FIRM|nr:stage 0 sporulation protein [Anaerotalea alkaliphila]
MVKVIGVRFKKAGKVYYFDPEGKDIAKGQHVIVETVRGVEYGKVVLGTKEVQDESVVQPLRKVLRVATAEDDALEEENKAKEREAFALCQKKIKKHNLEMKLVDSEYTFDNNKLLFYFTADGRIDFRELVKDLASVFKTRIELRQIGVRDETKLMGSIGICGRSLCCNSFLSEFHPVSIKMAKEQNLSLNPTKISGVCGRLMCCLKYEESTYEMLHDSLPQVGDIVTTPGGKDAEVININIIRQLVKVVVRNEEAPEILEYKTSELTVKSRSRRFQKASLPKEEYAELKKLETMEKTQGEQEPATEKKREPKREQRREPRKEQRKDPRRKPPKDAPKDGPKEPSGEPKKERRNEGPKKR